MSFDYTVETYKFAASYLNRVELDGLIKEPEQTIFDTVFKVGIARKVASFLKGPRGTNYPHAAELGSILGTLSDRVELHLRKRAQVDAYVQRAQKLVTHGEGRNRIPFANTVIHFYAGRRLESFIDERIADGSGDKWYEFCKTLTERITSFLGIYIAEYESALGKDLSAQRDRAMQRGKVHEIQLEAPTGICGLCVSIYFMLPQFSSLLVDLDATLIRMGQYVTRHQPSA